MCVGFYVVNDVCLVFVIELINELVLVVVDGDIRVILGMFLIMIELVLCFDLIKNYVWLLMVVVLGEGGVILLCDSVFKVFNDCD